MIIVSLRGGLGNQMFQYAAGLAAARKNDVPLVLDTAYLNDRFPRKQFTFRTYDLDIFELSPKFTALSNLSVKAPIPGVWLGLDLALANIKEFLGLQKFVKEEKEFSFDPKVFSAGKNIFLWGFWQTPKYFEGIEDEIREAFRFRYPLEGEAATIAEDIKKHNSIALHVRRADYVMPKYQEMYGETNLSYYDKAVRFMTDHVKDPKFYVFSDDVAWCKENIKLAYPMEYIERSSEGPKANYHVQLMSLCKHNIVANSTFSWWAAWLNQNPGKIVVAPKEWSRSVPSGECDIIPSSWQAL
jgi:hypothetical protein